MKQIIIENFKINIYRDIIEWGVEFYNMPSDAILENKKELESECMGFACPEDNLMSIFICQYPKYRELEKTVAHELGHLITFNRNPLDVNEEYEEKKAEHYEWFWEMVDNILDAIHEIRQQECLSNIIDTKILCMDCNNPINKCTCKIYPINPKYHIKRISKNHGEKIKSSSGHGDQHVS